MSFQLAKSCLQVIKGYGMKIYLGHLGKVCITVATFIYIGHQVQGRKWEGCGVG